MKPSPTSASCPAHRTQAWPWALLVSVTVGCGSTAPASSTQAPDAGGTPAPQVWSAAPGWQIGSVAAASSGSEAAIAFVEGKNDERDPRYRIVLQRIDEAGARRGPGVELVAGAGDPLSAKLTLATDGSRTLACWSLDGQLSCAAVGDVPSVAFQVPGVAAGLVQRAGVWALVYRSAAGDLVLQKLTNDGGPVGPGQTLVAAAGPESRTTGGPAVLLTATNAGFVMVYGAPMAMHWFDGQLQPRGAPLDLGVDFWFLGSVAANDSTVLVNLAKPYGSRVFVVNDGKSPRTFEMRGGGKTGLDLALAADGASLAAAWSDGTAVRFGTFDGVNGAPFVEQILEQILERPVTNVLALVPLGGHLLVATGGLPFGVSSEIEIGRLPQPR